MNNDRRWQMSAILTGLIAASLLATGLARALEVALQLRGEAGSRQLEGVEVGLAQSWRGVPTTSGAVAILAN